MAKKASAAAALDAKLDAKIAAEQSATGLGLAHLTAAVAGVEQINAKQGVACTIAIDRIVVVRNTRKHFDEPALEEMARTIIEHGILQPLVVRAALIDDLSDPTTTFDLVAGERRLRAARLAGLTEVPVSVRWLTDRQFLELQVLENLQRQDINPADEAEALAELLAKNFTIVELAQRLGRSPQFVAQRAQIGSSLSRPLMDLLRDGVLSIGAAIVFARVPASVQSEAISDLKHYHQPVSASDAHHLTKQAFRELDKAPFSKDAPDLNPDRPGLACVTCTERSGAQEFLFADLAEHDRCLTPTCFAAKVVNHLALQTERIVAETGQKPLLVSDFWQAQTSEALSRQSYRVVNNPQEEGAVPALVVEGSGSGSQVFVVLNKSASSSPPDRKEQMQRKRIERKTQELLGLGMLGAFMENPEPAISAYLDEMLVRMITYAYSDTPKHFLPILTERYGLCLDQRPDDANPAWMWPNAYLSKSDQVLYRELAQTPTDEKLRLLVELDLLKKARWSSDQSSVSREVEDRALRLGLNKDAIRKEAEKQCTPVGAGKQRKITADVAEEGVTENA